MRSNTLCRAPFLWQWFQMCGRKCHSKKKQVIQNVAFRTLCLCCFYIVKSFYLTPDPCLVLSFVFFVLVLSFGKNLPLKCLELYLNYWFAHEGMYCKILIWGGAGKSFPPLVFCMWVWCLWKTNVSVQLQIHLYCLFLRHSALVQYIVFLFYSASDRPDHMHTFFRFSLEDSGQ